MSNKIEIPNIHNLAQRYLSGEPIQELAREAGVSIKTVYARLKDEGYPLLHPKTNAPKLISIPNRDALLRRYLAGESENALAREAGVNRWTFRRRLIDAGITPRSQSEAEVAKWERMTANERANQVRAAHAASRGKPTPLDVLARMAAGREATGSHIVPTETKLATHLSKAGFDVTQQMAVGIYNIDVAVNAPPVAVEIFGGHWHTAEKHARRFYKRTKYLLNRGWSVLIIWVDGRLYPLDAAGMEYAVAFVNELRRHPSPISQYRVILGDGTPAPARKSYLNTPADVERLCRR